MVVIVVVVAVIMVEVGAAAAVSGNGRVASCLSLGAELQAIRKQAERHQHGVVMEGQATPFFIGFKLLPDDPPHHIEARADQLFAGGERAVGQIDKRLDRVQQHQALRAVAHILYATAL